MQADAAAIPPASAASTPPKSLYAQMLADAAAPPVAPVAAAPAQGGWEKFGGEVGRQLGLTVRHGITGLTSLPALAGNVLNSGVNLGIDGLNAAAGTNLPRLSMPTDMVQSAENAAGLPQPRNGLERVVGDATAGMASVSPSMLMGKLLAGGTGPVSSAVGATLRAAPGNQIIASGTSGAAGGGAQEAGVSPGWQLGASVLGGAVGALGSAAAAPVARAVGRRISPPTATPQQAGPAVEAILSQSAGAPSAAQQEVQTTSAAAMLSAAPGANPFAAARAADFRSLGMNPTLGQITREPGQYAREQNMRGLTGVGDPLLARFADQNGQLSGALQSVVGAAAEPYQAGSDMVRALRSFDSGLKGKVSAAYQAASDSSGAKLDVPLQGVAQDYATVLHDFGDKVPSGVRNNFDGLGLNSGTQRKIFGVDDAENLLKVINANRGIDPATNTALDRLSQSVKSAVLSADDQGGVFAPARALAAERFGLHDKVPALSAAVNETVAPDDFVRRFITNGKTQDLQGMASILRGSDPAALATVRGQLGSTLNTAAFGQNAAGDKLFRPDSYGKALSAMGPEKLGALFTPEEIDSMQTIGRVGSYINARPGPAAVNSSNSGSAVLSLAKNIPFVGKGIDSIAQRAFVAKALRGDLANTSSPALPAPGGALGQTQLAPVRLPATP